MKVGFFLIEEKVNKLALQPPGHLKRKMITTADLGKFMLWHADFSKPEPQFTKVIAMGGHKYAPGVLSWSPRGNYLLTACDFVNIWKDDGDKLKNLFKLSQEENAVTTADWSPDEKRVVIGSRPDNLYVHDVDLNQQIKKIKLEYIPLAVSWDPRNGYVALLTLENCVTFYDALTFDQKKKVSFNAGSSKFSDLRTKRNERIITWSPDGEFCMCPNLEDKNELPMLLGIDRPKGFVVSSVFAGPTASISCISFLDALFRKGSDLYCIFAMGDCDGNISIWQTKGRDKPIHYIKGGAEDMVIENIYWDQGSKCLIASTTKKFLFMIQYDPKEFGELLDQSERANMMEGMYGHANSLSKTPTSYLDQRRMLEREAALNKEKQSQIQNTQPSMELESRLSAGDQSSQNLNKMIPSEQPRKIEIKRKIPTANAGTSTTTVATTTAPASTAMIIEEEKKEAMAIEKNGAGKESEKKDGEKKKAVRQSSQLTELSQQIIEKICFPKLTKGLDNFKVPVLDKNNTLYIRREKRVVDGQNVDYSKLMCLGTMGQNVAETLWTETVEGKILCCDHNSKFLCFYTDNHLLHINHIQTGKKAELPLIIPNLARMKLNADHIIMVIRESGEMTVYNFETKKTILSADCYSMVKELNPGNPPKADDIYLDDNGIPYIKVRPNLIIFYDQQIGMWKKVDGGIFSFGIFRTIPKPFKVNQTQWLMTNKTPKDRFEDMIKEIAGGEVNPEKLKYENRISVIRKIEEAMLFAISTKDIKAYHDLAGLYIRKLADFHEYNKIRCFIIEDLMQNTNGKEYMFIKSNLKSQNEYGNFINYLKGQLSLNSEAAGSLLKEIEDVLSNLNFSTMFKSQQTCYFD